MLRGGQPAEVNKLHISPVWMYCTRMYDISGYKSYMTNYACMSIKSSNFQWGKIWLKLALELYCMYLPKF